MAAGTAVAKVPGSDGLSACRVAAETGRQTGSGGATRCAPRRERGAGLYVSNNVLML